ncbi:hypothetical protein LBMAG21_01910 [Armatimonadota bacterium]|nr:hypothetical protein LBMAG21_01910 [Armatimonadota bacterium]
METQVPLILVVENDLMFAIRIESVLKKLGYRVKTFGDASRAVEFATEQTLFLSIVSIGREKLAPLEVIARLKALPNPAPVLGFLSHTLIPEVRDRAKAAGCDLLVPNSSVVTRLPLLIERFKAKAGKALEFEALEEEE